jgi:hypothetical protein
MHVLSSPIALACIASIWCTTMLYIQFLLLYILSVTCTWVRIPCIMCAHGRGVWSYKLDSSTLLVPPLFLNVLQRQKMTYSMGDNKLKLAMQGGACTHVTYYSISCLPDSCYTKHHRDFSIYTRHTRA